MSEDLEITSVEDYKNLRVRKVKLTSGAVFKIRELNAQDMSKLLAILPEDIFEGGMDIGMKAFMQADFDKLAKEIIIPNILAPKIEPEDLLFMDGVDLIIEMMGVSGMSEAELESRDEFQPEHDSPSA